MIVLGFLAIIFLSLVTFKIYIKWNTGICTSTANLSGKTVIVTGANTGNKLQVMLNYLFTHFSLEIPKA